MDKHTEELAALYVLDILEEPEREAFLKELRGSKELQLYVHEMENGLHAPIRYGEGVERPDLLEGIHGKLGLARADKEQEVAPFKPIPWTFIWGVAAAILLLMNFTLLFLVRGQSSVQGTGLLVSDGIESRVSRLESELGRRTRALGEVQEAHTVLVKENAQIREDNTAWEQDYMDMAAKVLPFFDSKDGLSRFTVVELVATQSPRSPSNGNGYVDMAGYFLDDDTLPSGEAMGFTVWRDTDQRGFLDLYNLPDPPTGEDYFLWIRSSGAKTFTPVGYLPELSAGRGSLFYSIDDPEFRPVEVLITSEDFDQPGKQPSAKHHLVGP